MARVSRPPGFDMTYQPVKTQTFGPPVLSHLPSLLYLTLALALVAVVMIGSVSASGSWLFRYIVEEDSQRLLGARTLAVIVFASAVASVAKTRMGGVIIHPEGLETRDMLGVGWPRVRHYAWPQIDRIVLDARQTIALHLWDGRREWLPHVGARDQLPSVLERVAIARAVPIGGGTGLVYAPEGADR